MAPRCRAVIKETQGGVLAQPLGICTGIAGELGQLRFMLGYNANFHGFNDIGKEDFGQRPCSRGR
jgi:hypothetical protein